LDGKIKSWMFVSVIIVLVELGQLVAHYHLLFFARVFYVLAGISLIAMIIHYFVMKKRK
jgi:hypothetical protein